MKRRKIWLSLTLLAIGLMPGVLWGQNAKIVVNAGQASILNGEEGLVDVTLSNWDALPAPVPANTLKPLISVSDNLTILAVTNTDGSPASDLEILKLQNDPVEGHNVKVIYKPELAQFGHYTFRIRVQGNAIGTGAVVGTLGFTVPLNNSAEDDNSTTTIPIQLNLPVTLIDFDVERQEQSARLTWRTSEETNSDHFNVQRSSDGKKWTTIQNVSAAGESNAVKEYSAIDPKPFNGENLYRLEMIDKDGSIALSRVRSLKFEGLRSIIYPNPAADVLYINADYREQISEITIYNSAGQLVYNADKHPESAIDVSLLTSGIYQVRIKVQMGLRIVIA